MGFDLTVSTLWKQVKDGGLGHVGEHRECFVSDESNQDLRNSDTNEMTYRSAFNKADAYEQSHHNHVYL